MRNVIYNLESPSGYACGTCGKPLKTGEMFNENKWLCGHDAKTQAVIITVSNEEHR